MANTRQPKKVSNACLYCKARKRRCSAKQPCENCVAHKKTCEFRDSDDGRKKENFHRIRTGYEFHKQLIHSLLHKLRQGQDKGLEALIEGGSSLEDLAAYLVEPLPRSRLRVNPSTEGDRDSIVHNDEESRDLATLLKSFKTLSSSRRVPFPDLAIMHVESAVHPTSFTATHLAGVDVSLLLDQAANDQVPLYMTHPLNTPCDGPSITTLFTQYRHACQNALRRGASESVVLGPVKVNLDTALRGRRLDDAFTPSTWISEVQQKYESLDIYVRLIWIHFIHLYLRWAIAPTATNYDMLSECMRPTPNQRLIRHHAAIDLCHLPALRDVLMQRSHASGTNSTDREDIIVFQLAGLRTCWSGGWDAAVVFDSQLNYHTLSQQFIDAASRIEEWTAGQVVLDWFPELHGQMRFASEQTITIDDRQLFEVTSSTSCNSHNVSLS